MVEKTVTLYTTGWCPHCTAAKEYLEAHDTAYTEYDVEESDEKWHEAMEKANGKDIVPVVDIDGEIFYGPWRSIKEAVADTLGIED